MYNFSEKITQYLKKLDGEQMPVQNEQKTKKDKKSQLVETIKELNEQLNGKKNGVVLDKMEYTPLTDKEIEDKASETVDKKYALKENALETKKDSAVKNLELKNQELKDGAKDKKDAVEQAYTELEKDLNSNAIKRGIARSSIVSEQIKNLGVQKIRDLLGVDEKVADEIKVNSDKIVTLEQEYVQAIDNLSIEKAIELGDAIEKLKKEQDEKLEKVLKYNNDIKKQQTALNENSTSLSKTEIADIKSKMVNAVLEYYNSLPKEERLLAFESDEDILELLGENASLVERYLRATV